MIGQTISHYKITAKLGEGGMGAVYRATDTRLGREVALKILPGKFVRDRQRMGRFQREAEVLASLNHPHISIIHGLEEEGEVRALVLELVEGPTLAERISEGPIPVEEALRMALEIIQALETAHEKGIIHRDLKPANVKITPEGTVKVLDFGLAKALETEVTKQELANSPTLTLEATREGIVLGTAAYMSPEQARGRELDKRTDIWSFGLVLFEMLTGRGMYVGKSFTETLAAVIHHEPNLRELPGDTPWKIRELLERCLRKDSRIRLRDIGDARIAIDECLAGGATTLEETPASPPAQALWRRIAPWAAVPLLAAMAWSVRPDTPIPARQVSRFELPLPEGEWFAHYHRHALALSPDGTKLAFVARRRGSKSLISIRSFDRWEAITVPDDERVKQPFFSSDGKRLGFAWTTDGQDWKLKTYPLDGGPVTTLCDCTRPYGASWGSDDSIVFSCDWEGGLWRVSASGGEPEQVTELEEDAREVSHRLPHVLPGAKQVLYTVMRYSEHDWSQTQIVVQSLESGERKVLIEGGSDARYIPAGYLAFAREGTLWAAAFDLATLTVIGPEVPVLEGVSHAANTSHTNRETGAAQFTFSESGSLAYIAGSVFPEEQNQLLWVDRTGEVEPVTVDRGAYYRPFLSPNGLAIAFNKDRDIWTYDLARNTSSRQTFGESGFAAIWSPDGTSITVDSRQAGSRNLFQKVVDGNAEPERLFPSQDQQSPGSWSLDGRELAFTQFSSETQWDIWILPLDDPHSAEPFLHSRFREQWPAFSPNGRWLAYGSDEAGRHDVYVQSYPEKGGRVTISPRGGQSPAWAKGGSELLYRSLDEKMMSVEITIEEGELKAGNPIVLFDVSGYNRSNPIRSYDVRPDGQRFLMVKLMEGNEKNAMLIEDYFGDSVSIVLNWFEELERLVPTEY